MTRKTASRTLTLFAAAGLSALTPVQTGAAVLAIGTALWAIPALAQGNVPGMSIVSTAVIIKKKSGSALILAPSDANGEVRITGLEPGDYEVSPVLANRSKSNLKDNIIISVGQDGRLAFAVRVASDTINIANTMPNRRAAPGPSVVAIPFDGSGVASAAAAATSGRKRAASTVFDVQQTFRTIMPPPCDPIRGRPDTCNRTPQRNHIDVNASSAAEIVRLAPETSPAAAEALIAERARGGAFKNVQDFASRVCTKTSINFGDAPVRMGNASILVERGTDPKNPGFKCATGKDGGETDVSIINTLLTAWLIWYVSSL